MRAGVESGSNMFAIGRFGSSADAIAAGAIRASAAQKMERHDFPAPGNWEVGKNGESNLRITGVTELSARRKNFNPLVRRMAAIFGGTFTKSGSSLQKTHALVVPGKPNREREALALGALDGDFSSVRAHDAADDEQAEAGAAAFG